MNPQTSIPDHVAIAAMTQGPAAEEWQLIVAEQRRQLEQKMTQLRLKRQLANRLEAKPRRGNDEDKWEEDEAANERLDA